MLWVASGRSQGRSGCLIRMCTVLSLAFSSSPFSTQVKEERDAALEENAKLRKVRFGQQDRGRRRRWCISKRETLGRFGKGPVSDPASAESCRGAGCQGVSGMSGWQKGRRSDQRCKSLPLTGWQTHTRAYSPPS
eukprot:scaffold236_cov228-Pinguiococcus_pyrenoidosus.AAC.6